MKYLATYLSRGTTAPLNPATSSRLVDSWATPCGVMFRAWLDAPDIDSAVLAARRRPPYVLGQEFLELEEVADQSLEHGLLPPRPHADDTIYGREVTHD